MLVLISWRMYIYMAGAHSSANDLQRKRIVASAVRVATGLGRLTELSYLQHNVISHIDKIGFVFIQLI